MKSTLILILALAITWTSGPPGPLAQPALLAGPIAFVHEDSGSSQAGRQIFNLRLLDPRDPTQWVALTDIEVPDVMGAPVWSKDHRRLASSANLNPLGSLESQSIFAIDADGTALRQITGFGALGPIDGPTGTVIGHVEAPNYRSANRDILGQIAGAIVSARGTTETARLDDNNDFVLQHVPAGPGWVRVQADVGYNDPAGNIPAGGPGLSLGSAAVTVRADQTTDAGTIVIRPQIPYSTEPSWSRDGTRLVVTNEITSRPLQVDPNREIPELVWRSSFSHGLRIWKASGEFVGDLSLPDYPQVTLSGADWSPVEDRIACVGFEPTYGGTYVITVNPDGTKAIAVYQAPLELTTLRSVTQCRWSPDSRRIAFTQASRLLSADLASTWSDLFVINADGTGLRQLSHASPGQLVRVASWSPDGQFLACDVQSSPDWTTFAGGDLFAVSADGAGGVRLTRDGRSLFPAW